MMGKMKMVIATKVFPYSNESDHHGFNIVRIYGSELEKIGGRNKWVKIVNSSPNSPAIYRIAKGKKGTEGFTKGSVQIDYESREILEIDSHARNNDGYYSASLKIEKANSVAVFISLWHTNDPIFRIPLQISLVSLFIGVAGFIISILK
jgi:hypothetical protein